MLIEKYGYRYSGETHEINEKNKENRKPARVLQRNSNFYDVVYDNQFETVEVTGKFKKSSKILPVVGDYVWLEQNQSAGIYQIVGLMERKSVFSRKPAVSGGRKIKNGRIVGGSTQEQAIAANIDTAFIVTDLYKDFNIMRLERYITATKSGGVKPVIILNKLDLCEDPQDKIEQVKQIDSNLEILAISVLENLGIEDLKKCFKAGETVAFLGSSGVGKSSIMNLVFNQLSLETKTINMSTGKGKHTTTSGALFLHESGCMLIDTPGMRELTLWCDETQVTDVYEDILDIMEKCHFHNCKHDKEPKCAIKRALETGELSRTHYESYLKLIGDASHLKTRVTQADKYNARMKKRGYI